MTAGLREVIAFVRLGTKGYIAGVDFDAIVEDAAKIYPELSREDIVPVTEQSLPREYTWSVRRVKEFRDWENDGTYLLIKNFETYRDSFRRFFPDAQVA